jgi:hypothetical protein
MQALLETYVAERHNDEAGSVILAASLMHLMFVELIRAYHTGEGHLEGGWLGGTDGMSRLNFAARFKWLVGFLPAELFAALADAPRSSPVARSRPHRGTGRGRVRLCFGKCLRKCLQAHFQALTATRSAAPRPDRLRTEGFNASRPTSWDPCRRGPHHRCWSFQMK